MKKISFQLIVALSILMLALAACAGGANQGAGATPGAGDTTGGAVNETPVTGGAAGGETTGTQAAPDAGSGGAAANCVGVDTQALVTAGQGVYTEQCAGCHGEQGEGQGDFPALAGDANVTGEDIASVVQGYFAVDAHPKDITPDDLAAVLTYVRGSFGNTANAICPTDIQVPAAQ